MKNFLIFPAIATLLLTTACQSTFSASKTLQNDENRKALYQNVISDPIKFSEFLEVAGTNKAAQMMMMKNHMKMMEGGQMMEMMKENPEMKKKMDKMMQEKMANDPEMKQKMEKMMQQKMENSLEMQEKMMKKMMDDPAMMDKMHSKMMGNPEMMKKMMEMMKEMNMKDK